MLVGMLNVLFVLLCFFLVFIILLQRSKGSLGLIGSVGSNAQLLFGGSGGQDFLKRLTWWCVALFMSGSLILALAQNWAHHKSSRYLTGDLESQAQDTSMKAPDNTGTPQKEAPADTTEQTLSTTGESSIS